MANCRTHVRQSRVILLLLAGQVLAVATGKLDAQQNAPQGSPQTADDGAAKAAARRAKFEEERRRLEQSPSDSPKANQTLFISPVKVGMLVGETHAFSVFDIEGRNLTSSAEWSWSDSYIASFTSQGEPSMTSKNPGTVTLHASVGNQDAEATITVYPGGTLPIGTVKWSTPVIPGYRGVKFVQAVPTANGPDIYASDQNDQGDMLVRALLSDGRQLWMRRFPAHGNSRPPALAGTLPGVPAGSAPPHR